ncbi:exodeoxyribonuclease III [Candidatus Saccharibacteria bacterium]|nr:exodeoxyribonuclease III [Candidatus Saccharibacteria bacterium]
MNIFSWNVNGIRSVLKKDALIPFIETYNPDILCLQETKAKEGQAVIDLPEYTELWNSADRAGYSGTAIFTKIPPLSISNGFPEDLQISYPWSEDPYGDPLTEGRLQTAEFPAFYLVNTYVPNSKPDLSRLPLREHLWDPALLQYLKNLEKHKPVIICGDFNAAHTPIDLARPKDNEHNAGYTPAERQGITNLTNSGFLDTFRLLHPKDQKYTWWTWRARARERNVGWRIDYFFISESLRDNLAAAEIHNEITGSDHCPISITLKGLN